MGDDAGAVAGTCEGAGAGAGRGGGAAARLGAGADARGGEAMRPRRGIVSLCVFCCKKFVINSQGSFLP